MIWMPSGVRDHEMAGTMDVASLLQDIQSKQDWEIKSELSDKARRWTLHHLESFIDATDVGIEEPNRKCLKQLWKAQQEGHKQEIKEPEGSREEHLLLSSPFYVFWTFRNDSKRFGTGVRLDFFSTSRPGARENVAARSTGAEASQ